MDTLDRETRSRVMSAVRRTGNRSTELALMTVLKVGRISGWRRHITLIGNPDFAWPKLKMVVFVDGCFWHGCPTHCRMPKSNQLYWRKKVGANITRDRKISRLLRKRGWAVLRIWEHELGSDPSGTLKRIKRMVSVRTQRMAAVRHEVFTRSSDS